MNDPHLGFIVAAYLLTTTVLIGLVAAIVLDGRAQRRMLAHLEQPERGRDRKP